MSPTPGGLLGRLDILAHHPRMRWLPRWVTGWLCDRMDLRLGVTKTELHRVRSDRSPWPEPLGGVSAFGASGTSASGLISGTYACDHMAATVAGVSCGQCGPLPRVSR